MLDCDQLAGVRPTPRGWVRHPTILALLFSVPLIACSGETAPGGPAWTERDSAGVRIVDNSDRPIESLPAFRLTAEPTLSIGTMAGDPDLQFFQVAGGLRLPDGRIAIANGGSSEVRIYAADGSFSHAIGKEGGGPGEFGRPRILGRLGTDSLVVHDATHRRVSVLHVDEGFIRSFSIPTEAGGYPMGRGMFADGTQMYGGGLFFSSDTGFPDGVFQNESPYVSVDVDGGGIVDFGAWPAPEMYGIVSEDAFGARSLPFGKGTSMAVGADRIWIGTSDRYEIHALDRNGTLTHILRLDRTARTVTPADVEQFKQDEIEDADSPDERRRFEAMMLEMPIPETMPAFGSMMVDALGNLWVQQYAGPRDRDPMWTVFDAEGRLVGAAQTPDRTQILEIGPDYILGRLSDELDVEYIQVWGLTRP